MTLHDQIIIGAGLSGLTTAWNSKRLGKNVLVLDSAARAGGVIHSQRKNDFLLELGPNTVQPTPELVKLVEELGLNEQIILANPKLPRYVQLHGQLFAVPMSISEFFHTCLLSGFGKIRLLLEPLMRRQKNTEDETLEVFSMRRLGTEATEKLLAPFVSGIWAGDISRLSAASSFPKLKSWENEHGSLFRGMCALRKAAKKSSAKKIKGLMSFPEGLETIARTLQAQLQTDVQLNVLINKINFDKATQLWSLETSAGEFKSKQIVCTIPASKAASLLQSISVDIAHVLESIEYSSVAVLHVTIKRDEVLLPPEGFGFLLAPSENLETLGCIFNSNLFPHRAPSGSILMTIFMGGARHPQTIKKSDAELLAMASAVLIPVLGLKRSLELLSVTRHEKAIPQYNVGYREKEKKLRDFESSYPGFKFGGNFLGGISVGDVVKNALNLSEQLK